MFKNSKFFYGYASIFNELDLNGDVILSDSFVWQEGKIPLLWEHDRTFEIGKITKITQNIKGLFVEGIIFSKFAKKHLKLSAGYIPNINFKMKNGVRYLSNLHLVEISVVKKPANKKATAICLL